jgi:hypothetical protein
MKPLVHTVRQQLRFWGQVSTRSGLRRHCFNTFSSPPPQSASTNSTNSTSKLFLSSLQSSTQPIRCTALQTLPLFQTSLRPSPLLHQFLRYCPKRNYVSHSKRTRTNVISDGSKQHIEGLEDVETTQLETALQRVMKLQSEDRTKMISGGLMLLVMGIYIYGDMIVQGVSGGVAEVTGSEAVTTQVELLAKAVVTTVLNDDQVLQKATEFVTALSGDPGTQQALVQLLLVALRHNDTQQELYRLSQLIVGSVLNNPNTTQQVVELFQRVMADPQTQDSVIVLLQQLMANPTTRVAMNELTTATLQSDDVQQQVNDVAASAIHYTLNDPAVFDHATQFVSGVLSEKDVQKSSGEHLWNAFTYSITPTLFGVQSGTGVGTTTPAAGANVPSSAEIKKGTSDDGSS